MQAEDLQKFIRARPFRPFEMCISDGARYVIRTPEILVSASMTVILEGTQFRFIDNEAIVSVKRLDDSVTTPASR